MLDVEGAANVNPESTRHDEWPAHRAGPSSAPEHTPIVAVRRAGRGLCDRPGRRHDCPFLSYLVCPLSHDVDLRRVAAAFSSGVRQAHAPPALGERRLVPRSSPATRHGTACTFVVSYVPC
jgi:hypothetical protein